MPRLRLLPVLAVTLLVATATGAQERLTLQDAAAAALKNNPAVRGAEAAQAEARERLTQARAAYLPRVDYVESWQRGNQPVFVFGSLLAERRFMLANFTIEALNHPDPASNYRSGVTIEQLVFDGSRSRATVRLASLGADVARAAASQIAVDLRLATTQAFGRVISASAETHAAGSAMEAGKEDLVRAEHRRDVGSATEADVLAMRVHLARMEERRLRAASDETVARAELNTLMTRLTASRCSRSSSPSASWWTTRLWWSRTSCGTRG